MKNVPIKIIDRQFNFIGEIDSYESFIGTRSYFGIGSFELHLNISSNYANDLIKENIIFTTPSKAYVVLYREIDSIDDKLIVRGLQLKTYLSRYITYPPTGQAYHRINSNIEAMMKTYVEHNMIVQGITDIVVAPNQNRGSNLIFQTRYKQLNEELEKIGLASGMGWDIKLDFQNKKFVFDILEGNDRTSSQDILPPAILSIDYDNVGEQKLVESRMGYKNVAIVAGQGQGIERTITVVGDAIGLDRFELFVDARDIENAEDLPSRGGQKLAEMQEVLTFDSQILTNSNLVYEQDYDLGDIVTAQNKKWNVTLDTRINDITEIYESEGFRLDATLGNNIPTILDVMKKAVDSPITESSGGSGEIPDASVVLIESENFASTNVEGALNELFQNVNDGKGLIATAIVDKGGVASGSDTFNELASAIVEISGGNFEFRAGNHMLIYSRLETFTRSGTSQEILVPTKIIEAKVLHGGSIRVNFQMNATSTSIDTTYGQIFVNDSPKGLLRSRSGSSGYLTFTEDIDLQSEDLLQLYVWMETPYNNRSFGIKTFEVRAENTLIETLL